MNINWPKTNAKHDKRLHDRLSPPMFVCVFFWSHKTFGSSIDDTSKGRISEKNVRIKKKEYEKNLYDNNRTTILLVSIEVFSTATVTTET